MSRDIRDTRYIIDFQSNTILFDEPELLMPALWIVVHLSLLSACCDICTSVSLEEFQYQMLVLEFIGGSGSLS